MMPYLISSSHFQSRIKINNGIHNHMFRKLLSSIICYDLIVSQVVENNYKKFNKNKTSKSNIVFKIST